jgi:hypothetical protein
MTRQFNFHPRPAPIRGNGNGYRCNNDHGGGRGGRGGYSAGGRRYEGHRPGDHRLNHSNRDSDRVRAPRKRRQHGGDLTLPDGAGRVQHGDNCVQDGGGTRINNAARAVTANHQRNNTNADVINNTGSNNNATDIQALLNRNRTLLANINTAAANTTSSSSIFTPALPNTTATPKFVITPTITDPAAKAEALAERRRMQLRRDEALATAKVHKRYQYKGNDPIKKAVQNPKLRALLAGRKVPGPPKRHDAMVLKLGPRDMGFEYVEELVQDEVEG